MLLLRYDMIIVIIIIVVTIRIRIQYSVRQCSALTTKESTEETSPSQDATVDLEMDELNEHECMAAMTALIGHMHRNGITPKVEEVSWVVGGEEGVKLG